MQGRTRSDNVMADNGAGVDFDPDGHAISVVTINGVAALVNAGIDLGGGGRARILADGTFWFVPGHDFGDLDPGETRVTGLSYTVTDALCAQVVAEVEFPVG